MTVGGRDRCTLFCLLAILLGSPASGTAVASADGMAQRASRVILSIPPEPSPPLGAVEIAPLLEVFYRPPAGAPTDLGVFARAAAAQDDPERILAGFVDGAVAEAGGEQADLLAPAIPLRAASPAPAPFPTALAAAVDRLILGGAASPLGQGDWRAARAAIGAFYAARGFEPVWIDRDGPTDAGRSALARLRRAEEDGLDLAALRLPKEVPAALDPNRLAEAEMTIAAAVVAYAEQASGSRIAPSRVSPYIGTAPSVADPGYALAETAAAADPGAQLEAFNPPHKGYRDLREELKRLASSKPAPQRRTPRDLDDGLADATAIDDRSAGAGPTLDAPRSKRGSRLNRLSADSINPPARGGSSRRRAAILANMEMWRWEPRDMGARRIEVNIPDFSVEVYEGDTLVHSARVVVGKPNTPTPIFSNVMRYVLINPAWQVPDSIVKKEILPRREHFERLGYEVKSVAGRVVVRQPPGDDNALGRLAFMFPNDHSVYLHDTPARELFSEDMRALSHGCVRVEDPTRLAELVLGWSETRIDAAIGGPERTVFLPQPLPIHIEYFTDFVDESGVLQERPDVYGLAQRVAGTLLSESQD
jgi:L,D-transpeptidase YcbB